MLIGLLMVKAEDDILAETLPLNLRYVDTAYALTDTWIDDPKVAGQWSDDDLPSFYPRPTTEGARGFLYEHAVAAHGPDHWFVLLHADEVWQIDPRTVILEHRDADGFRFLLPFYLPREPWDDSRGVLEQLRWRLEPGWPEFRLFHGGPDVRFTAEQHFDSAPGGLRRVIQTTHQILHYPFRSPASQQARAAATWDPDNYHLIRPDGVFDDAMVAHYLESPHYNQIVED